MSCFANVAFVSAYLCPRIAIINVVVNFVLVVVCHLVLILCVGCPFVYYRIYGFTFIRFCLCRIPRYDFINITLTSIFLHLNFNKSQGITTILICWKCEFSVKFIHCCSMRKAMKRKLYTGGRVDNRESLIKLLRSNCIMMTSFFFFFFISLVVFFSQKFSVRKLKHFFRIFVIPTQTYFLFSLFRRTVIATKVCMLKEKVTLC